MQSQRNKIAKNIAEIKKSGGSVDLLLEESKKVNKNLSNIENEINSDNRLEEILAITPNAPNSSVPIGKDENDNIEIEKIW